MRFVFGSGRYGEEIPLFVLIRLVYGRDFAWSGNVIKPRPVGGGEKVSKLNKPV